MKQMSALAIEIRGYFIEQVIANGDNTEEGVKEILANSEVLGQINALCEIAALVQEGVEVPVDGRKEFFLARIDELMGVPVRDKYECPNCKAVMGLRKELEQDIVTGEKTEKEVVRCGVCSYGGFAPTSDYGGVVYA